jgi:hypothetical protein
VRAAGHQASEVHGPFAGASAMRSSPRASGLRPMCLDTIGTPTPVYGSRTTGSHATLVERQMTSSSSRICRSTSATLRAHGSITCRATRSMTGLTYVESSSATSKARTRALENSGSCATASSSQGKSFPSATDNDAISAFQNGTKCTFLIH